MDIPLILTNGCDTTWQTAKDVWNFITAALDVRAFVDLIKYPLRFLKRRRPTTVAPEHTQYVEDRIPYSDFANGVGHPVWRWKWGGTTIYDLHPYCPTCDKQMEPLPCMPRSAWEHADEPRISIRDLGNPQEHFGAYISFIREHEPCESRWHWCIECTNCVAKRLPGLGRRSSGGGDLRAQDLMTSWTDRVRDEIYRRAFNQMEES